jgi:hypothetical protein
MENNIKDVKAEIELKKQICSQIEEAYESDKAEVIENLVNHVNTVDQHVEKSMENIKNQINGRVAATWYFQKHKSIPPP